MISKSFAIAKAMGCCSCFGFRRRQKPKHCHATAGMNHNLSQALLFEGDIEDDEGSYHGEATSASSEDDSEVPNRIRPSEDILKLRAESGLVCRQFPVKETHILVRAENEDGNKMVNEYIREYKIGSGSYGKVVLYRRLTDGKHYAIKAFHKSHLLKLRVGPSETAMTDVLREVFIMKMVEHPNIVNLNEVIDDPESDEFYMVLEYVEGKWVCEGSGRACGLGEETARKYLRDIVSGLTYLHAHVLELEFIEVLLYPLLCYIENSYSHQPVIFVSENVTPKNIVHGDIKPDNLLVTRNGTVKIGDFSVSQACEDDNDELRRSPGTPVFTAPECCMGLTYHGKAADTWAVGVTLYCMILGQYPFLGDTLQDTYDKIVNNPLILPDDLNPQLKNLIEGLLCKDPKQRMTLVDVAAHDWVVGNDGPIPEYSCWCKRKKLEREDSD